MLQGLKPLYNRILLPGAGILKRLGVGPDHITITGLVFFCAAGFLSFKGYWLAAAFSAIAGALMDGLDGVVARLQGGGGLFGGVLDSVSDRVTEMVWLFGILTYFYFSMEDQEITMTLIIVSGFLSLLVSYIKARAEGAGLECSGGLFQRPERIIFLILAQILGPEAFAYGIRLFTLLVLITAVQRMLIVWRNSKETQKVES